MAKDAAKPISQSASTLIAALSEARRVEFERVLAVLRRAMPPGYEEVVSRKMVVYQVPLALYPDTYNGHPLWYVALASEKSYLSLHLMPLYGSPPLLKQLTDGFDAAGKQLNMGKACINFQRADELALDVIEDIVQKIPVDRWIEIARAAKTR
jgi:hypothetical protein